ncbi:hypothetical protein [Baekduia sp. Peel2402]|uniref:hypothetical protein n=1 Tax=Baekduia sp. Peel2402 TaxID=3458296 RepID=UPI00403EBC68
MTPATPLEATDPERARILKQKIHDRLTDVRRRLTALRTAMARFGEDFDQDAFVNAYNSDDPDALNLVMAVERGVDQLYNYMADLASFGLELATLRARDAALNARRDFDHLRRVKVLSGERTADIQRLRELRRLLVHEYAQATAVQVHEAAGITSRVVPIFFNAYRDWIKTGFVVPG